MQGELAPTPRSARQMTGSSGDPVRRGFTVLSHRLGVLGRAAKPGDHSYVVADSLCDYPTGKSVGSSAFCLSSLIFGFSENIPLHA
jgi:hypothetical protein